MKNEMAIRKYFPIALLALGFFGSLLTTVLTAAETDEALVTIAPVAEKSAYFGEAEIKLDYRCTAKEAVAGKLRWQYAAGARTLARGEENITIAAGQAVPFQLPMTLPPVRDGVVLATQFTVTIFDANDAELGQTTSPLWLFPQDPFVARKEWLKELQITLYDPVGDTASIFTDAEIPFEKIANPIAIADLEQGLLIVGEGVSLKARRSLGQSMTTLAQRGVKVLCLTPVDGEISWPTREDSSQLKKVALQNAQVVRELDKRLDPNLGVTGEQPDDRFGLELVTERGALKLQVSNSPAAWPWWQADYNGGGALLICSLGIIEHWEAGPTSRFLLARIFETIHPTPEPKSSLTEQ